MADSSQTHICTKNMLTMGLYYAQCAIEKHVAQDTEMTPFEALTLKDDQMRIFCGVGFEQQLQLLKLAFFNKVPFRVPDANLPQDFKWTQLHLRHKFSWPVFSDKGSLFVLR